MVKGAKETFFMPEEIDEFYKSSSHPDIITRMIRVVISDFLAPAYLSLALGLDYKPSDWLSVFLSPATGRATFVNNQMLANDGQFGVTAAVRDANGAIIEPGKKMRLEFGAYSKSQIAKRHR